MDEQLTSFLKHFATLSRLANESTESNGGTPLMPVLTEHLGIDPGSMPVVVEPFAPHRMTDVALIMESHIQADPRAQILGLAGPQRHHMDLADLISVHGRHAAWVGEPDYETVAVGPDAERRVVSFGLYLFGYQETALAVLVRQANQQYGRDRATLEVLGMDAQTVDSFLKEFKAALRENSIFRGHVISFTANDYSSSVAGVTFHRRASASPAEVILPEGTLTRIEAQVLGVGEHREQLLAHGAHLKRGVLLYGPPGTGKTHTVRYLASTAAKHTVILLSGNTLSYVSEAARMARALQPAIVVLEDCDLVAEDRSFGHGPQPLLFELLDAMDGLDTDADVAFLLTTNRVDLLEEALVQRPGRIDLAVGVPRPDLPARRSLLKLYGAELSPSHETIEEIAKLIEGTTASFTKELTRRAVLLAAMANETPTDEHLLAATTELMSDAATLTRSLLGGTGEEDTAASSAGEEGDRFGHVAGYSPGLATGYSSSIGFEED
ncbi:AAA family ATPase [Arthrobacter sp. MYb227]|uniref:AAA family ATPase n=1 Tax=Arthrobacter sp. MYb227 TaxID=1848601 RepID=UPI000CFD64E4|nr:ATP-binding protein [Arthrobacter sp. MYb227]PQZ92204.1 AAA family ATPase [Arthrobacter sp. MYb227]